jgi:predicted DNA-binding WGR domain protein
MTIAQTSLWYYGGSSDKVYVITVTNNNGTYTVETEWGRRGRSLQSQIKGSFDNRAQALIKFNEILESKTRKGYEVTGQATA